MLRRRPKKIRLKTWLDKARGVQVISKTPSSVITEEGLDNVLLIANPTISELTSDNLLDAPTISRQLRFIGNSESLTTLDRVVAILDFNPHESTSDSLMDSPTRKRVWLVEPNEITHEYSIDGTTLARHFAPDKIYSPDTLDKVTANDVPISFTPKSIASNTHLRRVARHFVWLIDVSDSASNSPLDRVILINNIDVDSSTSGSILDESSITETTVSPESLETGTTIDNLQVTLSITPNDTTSGELLDGIADRLLFTVSDSASASEIDEKTCLYVFKVTLDGNTSAILSDKIGYVLIKFTGRPRQSHSPSSITSPEFIRCFSISPNEVTSELLFESPVIT